MNSQDKVSYFEVQVVDVVDALRLNSLLLPLLQFVFLI
jgi:hypothetical protein